MGQPFSIGRSEYVSHTSKQNIVISTMNNMCKLSWKPTHTLSIYQSKYPYYAGTVYRGANCMIK